MRAALTRCHRSKQRPTAMLVFQEFGHGPKSGFRRRVAFGHIDFGESNGATAMLARPPLFIERCSTSIRIRRASGKRPSSASTAPKFDRVKMIRASLPLLRSVSTNAVYGLGLRQLAFIIREHGGNVVQAAPNKLVFAGLARQDKSFLVSRSAA